MNSLVVSLILVSVCLSVAAQILLKQGMSHPLVQNALNQGIFSLIWGVVTNIAVLAGLLAYVASAAVWLVVLSKVEVSKAYPFVGLGFVGTMLFAYWFLGEPLTAYKVLGTLLIVAGVFFISK